MDLFGSSSFLALQRGLDGSQMRQKAIANNISNVDTPNYKAKNVTFKTELSDALEKGNMKAHRTADQHIEFGTKSVSPTVETQRSTLYNHNQNNVDIDLEMAELAKNQIYYNALIDRLNGRFQSLKTVIRGGN